jgi:hypothetical protein
VLPRYITRIGSDGKPIHDGLNGFKRFFGGLDISAPVVDEYVPVVVVLLILLLLGYF